MTATVDLEVARDLLEWTSFDEPLRGVLSFNRAERRLSIGGECYRRFEPSQPSKRFDLGYESWEWSGFPSQFAAEHLGKFEGVRPSRVDVAFDYSCDREFLPEDLESRYKAFSDAQGFKSGVSGHGGVNTLYVGSPHSRRRLRVYRKDRQSAAFDEVLGPVLRVELVLKGEYAEAWWNVWRRDGDEAIAAAAGHVERMTNVRVQDDVCDVPPLIEPPVIDVAQQVFEFFKQYGGTIAAMHEAGVPVVDLANELQAFDENDSVSRLRRWRLERRIKKIEAAGVESVIELVRMMSAKASLR